MREILVDLLDEDWEKLVDLARKDGYRSSSDFVRKIVEDYIRVKYKRSLS